MIHSLADCLGIRSMGLSAASLRAGGATQSFREDPNIGRLQYLGRWKSAATLQHYLQEAMAAYVWARVSPESKLVIEGLLAQQELTSNPPGFSLRDAVGEEGIQMRYRVSQRVGSRLRRISVYRDLLAADGCPRSRDRD